MQRCGSMYRKKWNKKTGRYTSAGYPDRAVDLAGQRVCTRQIGEPITG
jgi:hypothetical protein